MVELKKFLQDAFPTLLLRIALVIELIVLSHSDISFDMSKALLSGHNIKLLVGPPDELLLGVRRRVLLRDPHLRPSRAVGAEGDPCPRSQFLGL